MTTPLAPKGLLSPSGAQLSTSNWIEITHDQMNNFADAIGDRQCIHVDPQRANVGPFGGTAEHH
jgi:acyl dehydratase